MTFHEERFPADLSFGSVGGPERRTEIVALNSGFEERNSPWAHSRRRYDAGVSMRSLDDMEKVIAFYEARRGPLFGFRWKDWTDYKSSLPSLDVSFLDQEIGVGDDVTFEFQLCKDYRSGDEVYCRDIRKPVEFTVVIGVGGDELELGKHYTVNLTTGIVTFLEPPGEGALVTAGFEFDVAVRFDADRLEMSHASFVAGEIPSIPVVELRV
ncbi:DUF2460 domain-containing protein [Amylibacter sp. SFDW26]|uniref:DUF2460 domain-containing protein n=1 Tax=Amylibacter sp. SFDW26 TaxID=2652722 RepID=UPI001261A853|nr:DUF2460 domain-containing protein [Amylibacter sp. SFDW26]KAB7616074.1 DUF2460 domain-containing protein [Amylibacter sp. SFDW26]